MERTREPVVLDDAARAGPFLADPYIVANRPRSLLCMPLLHQGELNGILYLENNRATGVFSPARMELLELLCSQAAIALENALLYRRVQQLGHSVTEANERLEEHNRTLEEKVVQRTAELSHANERLQQELIERQHAEEDRLRLLRARIDKTIAWLGTLERAQFQGAEERRVTLPFAPGKYMLGAAFLSELAFPNVYFHAATAYAILRANGVDLGKMDFLGDVNLRDVEA